MIHSTSKPIGLQGILSRLKCVKQNGVGFVALCPSHDDTKQSLSIAEKSDKILLHCHAGCSVNAICGALGIKVTDLFNDQGQNGQTDPIVATYDYRDAEGNFLYRVVKTESKRFFQQRPGQNGQWINNLGGVSPTLYKLSELIEAVKSGEIIFVCEGEKDVENLVKLGLAATTNSGGAGKWRPAYSEYLTGANVVVLPDSDDVGRKHAEQIAQSLHGKAASVKMLKLPNLPPKGDVSDWLAAGGERDELLILAAECPEWKEAVKTEAKAATKKEKEQATRYFSFFVLGTALYEQIYKDGTSSFIEYDTTTKETKAAPFVMIGDETIKPINGEDVELGAVRLPSNIAEYGDTLTLLSDIERHIYKHLDVSPNYLKFAAYYVLLSWVYDRFHTLPYLRALGDTGCGKSRFLDVIGGLCYKSISASGCVTPAPIYRMLKKWRGTLVLDEADMKNSDEYSEIVTILNCGFEQGRPVIRATKDNPDQIQILPVYGPKIFATRRRFKDVALEARCLTEILRETDRDDIAPVLNRQFHAEQRELRNKLLLFRLRNYAKVDAEAAVSIKLGNVEPRVRQVSDAFISLFANSPEVLESFVKFIRSHQAELIEQRANTKTGLVVETLLRLIEESSLGTSGTSGTSYMVDREVVPGVSAGSIAEKIDMTAQAVGAILKGLGIKTKLNRRGSDRKREIVYDEVIIKKLTKRYIIQDDELEQDAGSTNGVVPNVPLDPANETVEQTSWDF